MQAACVSRPSQSTPLSCTRYYACVCASLCVEHYKSINQHSNTTSPPQRLKLMGAGDENVPRASAHVCVRVCARYNATMHIARSGGRVRAHPIHTHALARARRYDIGEMGGLSDRRRRRHGRHGRLKATATRRRDEGSLHNSIASFADGHAIAVCVVVVYGLRKTKRRAT